jgi:hypothetical protein
LLERVVGLAVTAATPSLLSLLLLMEPPPAMASNSWAWATVAPGPSDDPSSNPLALPSSIAPNVGFGILGVGPRSHSVLRRIRVHHLSIAPSMTSSGSRKGLVVASFVWLEGSYRRHSGECNSKRVVVANEFSYLLLRGRLK